MGAPFTKTSVTSYNSNPPSDDGNQVSSNKVLWATIKTKLADTIKNAFDDSEDATETAFGKVVGGAGITSESVDYTVQASDQGKTIAITGSGGITVTTPDATSVGSPFSFFIVNTSTGTVTVAGNNPGSQQTIDGSNSITLPSGAGLYLNTNGSNWFSGGQQGIFVGKQLQYGDIINGTIVESNATNAVTFSLKTLAGNDPSATDPVLICFRNATNTTGNYVFRSVSSSTSLTISSGSTLGASNGSAFDVALVLFDDAGTVRIGAMNPVKSSDSSIYPLAQTPLIASSTAEGGSGGADSAQTFYTGTAVTSKAYVPFAVARYTSGLSTAGSWNVDPIMEIYKIGTPLPNTKRPLLYHVSEHQSQNTASSTAPTTGAWRTVVLNTEVTKEISAASLSSNVVSLPAGTYEAEAIASIGFGNLVHGQLRLQNTSDSATLVWGQLVQGTSSENWLSAPFTLRGRFTIGATKNIELQVQVSGGNAAAMQAGNFGTEVYTDLRLQKLN